MLFRSSNFRICCFLPLAKLNLVLLALALLKLLIQEGASLLVSTIDLEALVEHLLVLSASSLNLLLLLLLVLRVASLFIGLRSRFATTSTGQSASRSADSTMSNGGTSTKCHTLGNGGSNSRKHATATRLLHGSRGRRAMSGSRGVGTGLTRSRSGTSGGGCWATAHSHTSSTSSRACHDVSNLLVLVLVGNNKLAVTQKLCGDDRLLAVYA
mmetsp:Transcript_13870/g.39962  ORF Transcript_13870/g.39962 Transcript_13870/m.39962 type:complete len:212 (+) Transcript_13870:181-816(+)